jgi:hypothetical protein
MRMMLHCSTFRSGEGARRSSRSLLSRPCVIVPGLLALGCVPERALSSYMSGKDGPGESVEPNIGSVAGSHRADAGGDAAPGEPPFDAAIDGLASQDAAAPRRLACRDECVCELREGLDFMFCATLVSFQAASDRCAGAGGSLPSVGDEALNSWLTQRMQALARDDFWLSGTDGDTEGVWRWADGTVFFDLTSDASAGAFAPWDAQQPNDLNGEDCMRSTAGVWRDLDCADQIAYACQG